MSRGRLTAVSGAEVCLTYQVFVHQTYFSYDFQALRGAGLALCTLPNVVSAIYMSQLPQK